RTGREPVPVFAQPARRAGARSAGSRSGFAGALRQGAGHQGCAGSDGGGVAMSAYSQERLMQVLLAPQISEKATYVADKNEQVVFKVASDATKPEVKAAVE